MKTNLMTFCRKLLIGSVLLLAACSENPKIKYEMVISDGVTATTYSRHYSGYQDIDEIKIARKMPLGGYKGYHCSLAGNVSLIDWTHDEVVYVPQDGLKCTFNVNVVEEGKEGRINKVLDKY